MEQTDFCSRSCTYIGVELVAAGKSQLFPRAVLVAEKQMTPPLQTRTHMQTRDWGLVPETVPVAGPKSNYLSRFLCGARKCDLIWRCVVFRLASSWPGLEETTNSFLLLAPST